MVMGEDGVDDYWRGIHALRGSCLSHGIDSDRFDDAMSRVGIVCLDGVRLPLLRAGRQDDEPRETEWVAALAERIHGARLAIIDPLVMFHSVSEADNGHLDILVRLLIRLARQAGGSSILASHHTSQDGLLSARDDHQSGRGGTALASGARAVWTLRRPSKLETDDLGPQHRVLRGAKISQAGEQDRVILRFDEHGILWRDVVAEARLAEANEERETRKRKKVPRSEKGIELERGHAEAQAQRRKSESEPGKSEPCAWRGAHDALAEFFGGDHQ